MNQISFLKGGLAYRMDEEMPEVWDAYIVFKCKPLDEIYNVVRPIFDTTRRFI